MHKLNKRVNHAWSQNYLKKGYLIHYDFIFTLLKNSYQAFSLVSKVLNALTFQHRFHLPERLSPVKPQNTETVSVYLFMGVITT